MEALLYLILIAWVVLFFLAFPIWAIVAIRRTERKADETLDRFHELETTLEKLQKPVAAPVFKRAEEGPAASEKPISVPKPAVPATPPVSLLIPVPPPLPFVPKADSAPQPLAEPPAGPQSVPESPPAEPQVPPKEEGQAFPEINWERFMGVNLFAWIGGLALFLGAAFFVKYSIDNNLISPQLRVAIGFLLGAGLLVTGLRLSAKEYKVTSHTLSATAIVILYADIFAAHSFYGFINSATTFY